MFIPHLGHRSSAWYERVLGKHEVAGPNPVGGFNGHLFLKELFI